MAARPDENTIIWILAAAFPLYFTFISSFKDNSQIFSAFLIPSLRPVFDNYVMAQKMAGILKATANSLFVSGSAIAIMLLFCTMAAYVTARKRVPFASAVSAPDCLPSVQWVQWRSVWES